MLIDRQAGVLTSAAVMAANTSVMGRYRFMDPGRIAETAAVNITGLADPEAGIRLSQPAVNYTKRYDVCADRSL